ncbi:hypothetical protein GF345_00555 [Candidatus Woesearchaeota archaeon]|nr:hypothetical protein [Candidatus Woesearchaeota archaeon]
MDLEIKKERETPLLSRKRITMMMDYKGATPSRLEFRDMVSKQLKAPEELVIIKHIYTRFGQNRAKIIANIYKDKKSMESIEQKYILEKHKAKKEEGAEDKPEEASAAPAEEAQKEKTDESNAEEKPAEAPAEEKKEEAPAEEEKGEKQAEKPKPDEKPAEEAPVEDKKE